ncbi:MAG: ATP synthase F1 subunit delta, partial [Candidatus Marinimicrobia bacterium]|nr:ATP synthase F1 subunit delta [Candidatus Neomarinimicrobiota bacterium]
MKLSRREKKYAEALLAVSKDLNCIPETGYSLQIIDQLIKQEKVFRTFFYTQRINPVEKVNILKLVLDDLINQIVYEFFTLLAERNEYQMFMSVVAVYAKLQKESLNQIDVTAYSIERIDKDIISTIIRGVEKSTGKIVELRTQTDKELLGGLKLRVGNTIFDGTIANQMTKMKKVLL